MTHSPDLVAVALFPAVFCGYVLFALFAKSCWSSQVHLVRQLLYQTNERLVSKETVVLHWWGCETLKLHVKQVDQGRIATLKR